jgi:hypothetical protein
MATSRVAFQHNTATIISGSGAASWASVLVVQKLHTDQGHATTAKASCFGAGKTGVVVTMNMRANGAIGKMGIGAISAWTTHAMAR